MTMLIAVFKEIYWFIIVEYQTVLFDFLEIELL